MMSLEEKREYHRRWLLAHPGYRKMYYLAHLEKAKAQMKIWYENHKIECQKRTRAWELANPERAKALQRASYKRHKAEQSAQVEAYKQAHPKKVKMWRRISHCRRRLLVKGMPVATHDELAKIKARQKGRCFYCRELKPLTLDHVIPLTKRGSSTAENLVFACRSCNSSKGNRLWRIC